MLQQQSNKKLGWKQRKAAFRARREASNAAVARIASEKADRWKAEIARFSAKRIAEGVSPLRVDWLVRELDCGYRTQDKGRIERAANELLAVKVTCENGFIWKVWPVPYEFDGMEMHCVSGCSENTFGYTPDFKFQLFEIHPDDAAKLFAYQRNRDEDNPIVFTDNVYYRELEFKRPMHEPKVRKPSLTAEEMLDHLAALPPHEYESYRAEVAAKLKFRPSVLDKEYKRRRWFLFREAV